MSKNDDLRSKSADDLQKELLELRRAQFSLRMQLATQSLTKNSEIALWVFNAFDEVYAVGGNATEWQLAPPRSAELSYRVKY